MPLNCGDLDCSRKFVLGADVGTTNLRCYVYDDKANIIGKAEQKVKLLYPEEDKIEIDPECLWLNFKKVVADSLISAKLTAKEITCLGISTLRSTFVTWDRETGVPFHNFITWKDRRADKLCNEWNSSARMRLLRLGASLLYLFSRNKRFQAASILKLTSTMVLMRLVWVLQNVSEVREKSVQNQALFGTIDTWLVWKLTGGKVHATDGSNACVTGFFDPFQMAWAKWAVNMFHIPTGLLPSVKSTSGSFGETLSEIFGAPIPINAVVGDQQSSMFGVCCFDSGDVNCTLGTGSFLNINTGETPYVSTRGVYPLVGWTIGTKTTYVAECGTYDTGTIVSWAQSLGLFEQPYDSSKIASSVSDNGGVYFVPAFNGLQTSQQTCSATAAFMGLKAHTTKAHIVRSILEALAFQVCMLYQSVTDEGDFEVNVFRVCGGVSNNDFIVQLIADLASKSITRSKHYDTSSLGAAFLAGLSSGIWEDKEELLNLPKDVEYFSPHLETSKLYKGIMQHWKNALSRCLNWHTN